MNKQLLSALVALAAFVCAGWFFFSHRSGNLDVKAGEMHRRGGSVMAKLAAKTIGGKGRVLLIVADETKFDPRRAQWIKDQAAAFESGISGITVEGRETLAAIISRVNMASNRPTTFTLAVYRDFLKRHPGANAVVSFVGEPIPAAGEAVPNGEAFPPMICFSPTGEHIPELMAQGLVAAAIVPRRGPVAIEKAKGDWFDVMYEVVTPDTVAAWAEAVRRKP